MKPVIRLLIALSILYLVPAAEARPLSWVGTGVQSERGMRPMRWTIRLAFDRDGNGRIAYPSLACGGSLTRLRVVGRVAEFRERIRYGRRICVDNGTVKIVTHGNRLSWRWTGEHTRFPGMRARATLLPLRHRLR